MEPCSRWVVRTTGILIIFWLIAGHSTAPGADDDKQEVRDAIAKIADLLDKGQGVAAQKEVQALVNKQNLNGARVGSLKEPMALLKPERKGGIGIGPKGDGIEKTIIELGKGTPPKLPMNEIKKAGYIILALGQVTHAATPKPALGKKSVKDWERWSKEMQDASRDLIEAADKQDLKKIAKIAKNLDGTCTECHQVFR
jgi:hypothetical protein